MEKPEGKAFGRVFAAIVAGIMLVSMVGPATAHRRPERWWQYEKRLRRHGSWSDHRALHDRHSEWHRSHTSVTSQEVTGEDGQTQTVTREEPTYTTAEHEAFHHALHHRHLKIGHRFRVVAKQRGTAAWYDMAGQRGACGKILKEGGMYAAHRTWPCGSLVAVKRGRKVVRVRILDRGPFVNGWIVDLSPRAMRKLAGDRGTVEVKIFRLKRRR